MAPIATREDLDRLEGTPEYREFMRLLAGTLYQKTDVAVYPPDYHDPGYAGPKIEPVWQNVEDLSVIERFGFSRADFAV